MIASIRFVFLICSLTCLLLISPPAFAQASSFTYQGQLRLSGEPFTGMADLDFRLYDQLNDGNEIGSVQSVQDWPVEDGLFQVELDFGFAAFDGSERFLEITVDGASLIPRQRLSPTPYALALRGLRVEPSSIVFEGQPITANVIGGSRVNEVTTGTRGATIAGGGVPAGDSDPDFNNGSPNRVTDHYGVVSGGFGNRAGDDDANPGSSVFATVSGGLRNTASGPGGTVGGGAANTASAASSTVSGGDENTASGSSYSTVSGGFRNTASAASSVVSGGLSNTASGTASTVSGGSDNCAGGRYSWAGGRNAKIRPGSGSGTAGIGCNNVSLSGDSSGDEGTFIWAGDQGFDEFVSNGPNQFLVRAAGGAVITGSNSVNDPDGNRLRVNGTLRVDDLGTAGSTSLCRNSNNQIASCSSSERYKRDIQALSGSEAVTLVKALEPVRYQWIDGGQADIGLLAEEVAKVIPEIVTYSDDGQIEGFEYSRLGAVLIAAFQQQQSQDRERFAQLEADHRLLAKENSELRTEVAVLKDRTDQLQVLSERNERQASELATLREELALLRELVAPRLAQQVR